MKSVINKYTKEVEDILNHLSLKNETLKTEKLKKYIGTNLKVLGLNKKQTTDYKLNFSFDIEDKEKLFLIFDGIYNKSNTFETKSTAFTFLDKHYNKIGLKLQLKILPTWVKSVDNWAHSDTLSKFLTRLLENEITTNDMLGILKKWNSSKNLWERRQSLVALYYYSRTKKQHISFKYTQAFITPLLNDEEYYVQKAIGWTLREAYNVYPEQSFDFIKNNIHLITPIAFTTCIEKMTELQKQTLKLKRKKIKNKK